MSRSAFQPVSDAELDQTLTELQDRLAEVDEDDLTERWEIVSEHIDPEVGLLYASDLVEEEDDDEAVREVTWLTGDDLDDPREGIIAAIEIYEPLGDDAGDGFDSDSLADPLMEDDVATEIALRKRADGSVIIVGAFDNDGTTSPARDAAVGVTRARWLHDLSKAVGPGGGVEDDATDFEPIDPEDVAPFLESLTWNLVPEDATEIDPDEAWPVLRQLIDRRQGLLVAVDQTEDTGEEDAEVSRLSERLRGESLDTPNDLLLDFVLLCNDLLPEVLTELESVVDDPDAAYESVISVSAGQFETHVALRQSDRGVLIVGLFDTDADPDEDSREAEIQASYDAWIEAIEDLYGPGELE